MSNEVYARKITESVRQIVDLSIVLGLLAFGRL